MSSRLAALAGLLSLSALAAETLALNAVDDAPDPFSPPVSGPAAISGTFTFSGTGPDVDNAVVTEQALLRMTVIVTGPVGQTFLSATVSASRNPGDPNEITKTLTVDWDAGGLPDGLYSYTVSGAIVQFHQNHRGQNTEPQENVKATSNLLSGTILVDATPPAISDLSPPDGGFTGESQPAISASFSDSGSGIALASLDVKLDSWPVAVTAAPSGFSFIPEPLEGGVHTVTVSLADYAGNTASVSWSFTAGDSMPPEVTPPQDVVAEAEFESGAYVPYPPATATDNVTGDPVITYSQASGTIFPLGVTTVIVTATDAAGNTGTATFQVAVQDTTPPVVYPPGDVVIEATSCDGALVYYDSAYAWDAVTSWPVLYYSQPSGSLFPIAATTVYITGTDAAGNTGSATFQVVVQDTTPPAITQPADVTVETHSQDGAAVAFDPIYAYDAVTIYPAVVCDPPSGSWFPLGPTTVTVTATDEYANSSTAAFAVTVIYVNHAPIANDDWYTVEAGTTLVVDGQTAGVATLLANDTDPDGDALAVVNVFPSGNATVNANADGTFSYTPAPGFVGEDTFSYAASDGALTSETATVHIVVSDTIAPVIADVVPTAGSVVPTPQPVISASVSDTGSAVNWWSLFVILDSVPMQVTLTDTGFQFLPPTDLWEGQHTVSATVYDNAGNIAGACWSFTVDATGPQITNLTPPDGTATNNVRPGISATIQDAGSGVDWSSLLVVVDGVQVTFTFTPDGFTYTPPADLAEVTHTVQVWVTDNAGNASTVPISWSFLVDITPPVIFNPSPEPGTTVDYDQPLISADYLDAGTGIDPFSLRLFVDGQRVVPGAYQQFFAYLPDDLSEGEHIVEVTVADHAGNVANGFWAFAVMNVFKVKIHTAYSQLPQTFAASVTFGGADVTTQSSIQWRAFPVGLPPGNAPSYALPSGLPSGWYSVTLTASYDAPDGTRIGYDSVAFWIFSDGSTAAAMLPDESGAPVPPPVDPEPPPSNYKGATYYVLIGSLRGLESPGIDWEPLTHMLVQPIFVLQDEVVQFYYDWAPDDPRWRFDQSFIAKELASPENTTDTAVRVIIDRNVTYDDLSAYMRSDTAGIVWLGHGGLEPFSNTPADPRELLVLEYRVWTAQPRDPGSREEKVWLREWKQFIGERTRFPLDLLAILACNSGGVPASMNPWSTTDPITMNMIRDLFGEWSPTPSAIKTFADFARAVAPSGDLVTNKGYGTVDLTPAVPYLAKALGTRTNIKPYHSYDWDR